MIYSYSKEFKMRRSYTKENHAKKCFGVRKKLKWNKEMDKVLPELTMEEEAVFKIIEPLDTRQRSFCLMLWKGTTKEAAARYAGYANHRTGQDGNACLVAKRLKPFLDALAKVEIASESLDKEYLIKNVIEDIERGRKPLQTDKFGIAKIFTRSKAIEMGMKHKSLLGQETEEKQIPQTLVLKVETQDGTRK